MKSNSFWGSGDLVAAVLLRLLRRRALRTEWRALPAICFGRHSVACHAIQRRPASTPMSNPRLNATPMVS